MSRLLGLNWDKQESQPVIALLTSMCLHLLIVIPLALVVIGANGHDLTGLSIAMGEPTSDDSSLTEFDLSSGQDGDDAKINEVENTPLATNLETLPVSTSLAVPTVESSSQASQSIFDQTSINAQSKGSHGNGGAAGNDPSGGKSAAKGPGTSFFGVEAHGNRFVYVIDSSKSMVGPRWQALCHELFRGIQTLSTDQEFYVISFDFAAHPMFGTLPPKGTFLTAEKKNVEKLKNWVRAIMHGGATLPASSVGIAIRMKPDAIFLLSDGEINDSTVRDLRLYNRIVGKDGEEHVAVPIHTILLHSDLGYETLKTIAEENDGTFTPVSLRDFD